jgi:hypothetical protein
MMAEKARGKMKGAAGAVTGNEDIKAERAGRTRGRAPLRRKRRRRRRGRGMPPRKPSRPRRCATGTGKGLRTRGRWEA